MTKAGIRRTAWHTAIPILAALTLLLTWGRALPLPVLALLGFVLAAAVLSAVHHAEVVAACVGEPFGS